MRNSNRFILYSAIFITLYISEIWIKHLYIINTWCVIFNNNIVDSNRLQQKYKIIIIINLLSEHVLFILGMIYKTN